MYLFLVSNETERVTHFLGDAYTVRSTYRLGEYCSTFLSWYFFLLLQWLLVEELLLGDSFCINVCVHACTLLLLHSTSPLYLGQLLLLKFKFMHY